MARKRKADEKKVTPPKKAKAEPKKSEEELNMEALKMELADVRNFCPDGSTFEKLLPMLFFDLKEDRGPTKTKIVDMLRDAIAEGRNNLVEHEKQTKHDLANFDNIKADRYAEMQKVEKRINDAHEKKESLMKQKEEANIKMVEAKDEKDKEDSAMLEKQKKYDKLEVTMNEIREIYDTHVLALFIKHEDPPTKKEKADAEKAYKGLVRDHEQWKTESTLLVHTLPHAIFKPFNERTTFESDTLRFVTAKFERDQKAMEDSLANDKPDYSTRDALLATFKEKKEHFNAISEELKATIKLHKAEENTYEVLKAEFSELPQEFEKKEDEITAINIRIDEYSERVETVFEKLAGRTAIVEEVPEVEEAVAPADEEDVELVDVGAPAAAAEVQDDEDVELIEDDVQEVHPAVPQMEAEVEMEMEEDVVEMEVDAGAPMEAKAPDVEIQYETSQPVNHDTVEAAIAR